MGTKKTIALIAAFIFVLFPGIFLIIPFAFLQPVDMVSKQVQGPLPIVNPTSPIWDQVMAAEVLLGAQTVTKPILYSPSIRTVTVRTVHNGTWIAFLLEWRDATKDVSTARTEAFTDAAAIQHPVLGGLPFLAMGEAEKPVNIWQWRGDWQEDIEKVYREVEQAYPNMWVDFYPSVVAEPPYIVPSLEEIDKIFVAGWAAGNPISQPIKLSPISDLIAAGFGTLTYKPEQKVIGRGVWGDGVWKVVFARPMNTGDSSDAQLRVGEDKSVAFAIWDGGRREVDGRKAVSAWMTLRVEGASSPPWFGGGISIALVGMVGASITFLRRTKKI